VHGVGDRPLKLGVLGAGMIATFHYGYLPGTRDIPDKVEIAALCDPVVDRARGVAREYGVDQARVYARLEDMLEHAEFDVLLNLTPIPLHGATSRRALEAGKHVITEKPIATTMDDADALVETADARGLTLVCAPPNMLDPARQQAKRFVAEGAIGQVAFARVRSSHGGPAAGAWPADPTWFYQEGSGPLFDMGVYGIHDVTGILGPAKRVFAMSGITEKERTVRAGPFAGKRIEVTADDNTLMMLDFGRSAFAVVDGTFNVNAARGPAVEIFGRRGTLNLVRDAGRGPDPSQAAIELYLLDVAPGADGWVTPSVPGFDQQMAHFHKLQRAIVIEHTVDCIRSGRKPILSAEHGRHALEIMLRAAEAARSGRAVDLKTAF
jgi:predicted dehydrogenase